MSFDSVWNDFCTHHREFGTVLVDTSMLHNPLVLEVYRVGGMAEIGSDNKPGKDRRIIDVLADGVSVSPEERQLTIGDINPTISPTDSRFSKNAWFYSLLVSIQQMKYRPYEGYQQPFFTDGQKRGIWRLTDDGMDWGRKLADVTIAKK